jgi:VIT1/CCC1 family predicted Fe2+/Mn2+ transporter
MIGLYAHHAQTFLRVVGLVTTIGVAVPLFVLPLTWARLMMLRVPDDTDLTVYFGRCLGAFILVIELLIFRAAFDATLFVFTIQTLIAFFALMLVVHLYGWIKGIQPITENLENLMWLGLLVLAALFYPG